MKTLMIIDDDYDDVELFCEAALEVDPDLNCIGLENGEKALKWLRNPETEKPDFIFLDLNLPRLNGKDCLRQIKDIEDLRDIPVIIYSTSKLKEDIEETKNLGAVCFITKPSRAEDLRHAISTALESFSVISHRH